MENIDTLINFFHALDTIMVLVTVYVFLIIFATGIWTAQDISQRTKCITLCVLSVITVLVLPFLGLLIYLIARPQKTMTHKLLEEFLQNHHKK